MKYAVVWNLWCICCATSGIV